MTRRRRKISIFYPVLAAVISAGIAVVCLGLFFVNDWLSDYENALSKNVANEVFETYYLSGSLDTLLTYSDLEVSEFESDADVYNMLKALTKEGDYSFQKVSTGLEDIEKYNVKSSDTKFSSFYLAKSGEKSKYGHDIYELNKIELYISQNESSKIMAVSGYTVEVNGRAAGGKYIIEKGIETESCEHMPEGVGGIKYDVYEFKNLLFLPVIKVYSPSGTECEYVFDDERGCMRGEIVYSEELEEEMGEYVLTRAKAYAAFMQMDGNRSTVLSYFEKGTPLYEGLRTIEYYFVIPHTGYSFDDEEVSEFYAYDDNTFSCRVAFTHILHKSGMADYKDYFDVTFYLRKIDGKYIIYDRYNNN